MGEVGVILLFRAKGIKKQYAENYGDCFLGLAMGFCVNVEKLINILKTTLFIVFPDDKTRHKKVCALNKSMQTYIYTPSLYDGDHLYISKHIYMRSAQS